MRCMLTSSLYHLLTLGLHTISKVIDLLFKHPVHLNRKNNVYKRIHTRKLDMHNTNLNFEVFLCKNISFSAVHPFVDCILLKKKIRKKTVTRSRKRDKNYTIFSLFSIFRLTNLVQFFLFSSHSHIHSD